MRDPKRIARICKKLEEAWNRVPDWRLCQLIVNLAGDQPFYLEDTRVKRWPSLKPTLEELLDKFIKDGEGMWYK